MIARLLLSMLLMPAMAVLYIVAIVVIDDVVRGVGEEQRFLVAGLVVLVFAAVYWLLVWRKSVRWTTGRVVRLSGAFVLALVLGALTWGTMALVGVGNWGVSVFCGSSVSILGWLVVSVFIMRESAAERIERHRLTAAGSIACPVCGYNMTGLRTTNCPECGAAFTLDELFRARAPDPELGDSAGSTSRGSPLPGA
jgi:hypothetical protein